MSLAALRSAVGRPAGHPSPYPRHQLAGWCLLVGFADALTYSGDPFVATGGALLAMVLLPGLALTRFLPWRSYGATLSELTLSAVAIGTAWLVLTSLSLTLLGFGLGRPLLVLATLVALVPAVLAASCGLAVLPRPRVSRAEWASVGVLLFAIPLRLFNLEYSDFQGDEVEVILPAVGLLQRLPDVLFHHGKGPAEVLVVAAAYSLTERLTEASARLPFALFNIIALLGFSVVVTRWFGGVTGLVAGLLLAMNGYLVAFSRIAQYQSIVLLLSVAAIWSAERYRESLGRRSIWAGLAGLLLGVGVLAHYDAMFAVPPVVALSLLAHGRGPDFWRRALPGLVLTAAVGLAATLMFFGPYAFSPLVGLATDRIAGRVGDVFPRNNLPTIVAAGTLYLSVHYAVGLAALAAVGLVVGLWRPPVGVAILTPTTARRIMAIVMLWSALPFAVYGAAVRKPGTHIHVAMEGLTVVAAVAVGALLTSPRAWLGRTALALTALAACVPVLAYLTTFFLVTNPEMLRSGAASRYPLYWASGRDNRELDRTKEVFGFPYRAGWKSIGVLFSDGTLRGSYDSNENPQVTQWYTRDAWRCTANPRYYLIAEDLQGEIEPPRNKIASEYTRLADVTVHGRPKLHVYARRPTPSGAVAVYAAESLGSRFDRELSGPELDPGVWARGVVPTRYESVEADFGEVRLLGYQLYLENPRPGGVIRLDLYGLALVDGVEYRADVWLGRESRIGDGDGPGCDHSPAWKTGQRGQPFVQRISIPINQRAQAGRYPLLMGMRSTARPGFLPTVGSQETAQTELEIAEVGVME
jgi:hypothetical protein